MINVLQELGYKPKQPVKVDDLISEEARKTWAKGKKMKDFTFYNVKEVYQEVDVLIVNPIGFSKVFEGKELMKAEKVNIPVASIDHLIEIKKKSSRKQDEADVEELIRIKKILEDHVVE